MAEESVGKVQLDLGMNYDGFNNELKGVASQSEGLIGSAFGKLGGIIAGAFAVSKLIDFGKGAIELASNLNEVQNVVDVTFGNMSSQVDSFAKSAVTSLGLSELAAKKYTSTMGAMLKSSGMTGGELLKMSEGVTSLSADMASFYNISQEDAFGKIRAGLSGEVEPLRQLGINMSVANIQAYALTQGITGNYQSLSQAQQSLLRYNYIMSVTKDAQGDFARTSHSWANEVRVMGEQWKIFEGTMGQGFINILTPVLGGLNSLIATLQTAAQYFNAFTVALFGSSAVASSISTNTADAAAATDSLGTSAADAAKKVTNSLGSFDKLNVLTKSTASTSTPSAGGSGGGGVVTPTVDTSQATGVANKIKGMADSIKAALNDLFKPFKQSWDMYGPVVMSNINKIMGDIKSMAMSAGKTLANIWNSPTTQAGIRTLSGIFSDVLGILARIFDEVLKPDFQNFLNLLDPTKNPAADSFDKSVLGILTSIKDLTKYLGGDGFGIVSTFLQLFLGFSAIKFVAQMGLATAAVFADMGAWIANTFAMGVNTGARIVGFVASVAKSIQSLIANIAQLYLESAALDGATFAQWAFNVAMSANPIGLIIIGIAALIGVVALLWNKCDWFRNGIKAIFSDIWTGLKWAINAIIGGIDVLISGLNKLKVPKIDIPGIGSIGGWGFNIPEIPKLAQGGLVSAPTLAMVGDNKGASTDPEVVSPLSKLKGMMGGSKDDEIIVLLKKIIDMMDKDKPTGDVILKVRESELGRIAAKAINTASRQAGVTLVEV